MTVFVSCIRCKTQPPPPRYNLVGCLPLDGISSDKSASVFPWTTRRDTCWVETQDHNTLSRRQGAQWDGPWYQRMTVGKISLGWTIFLQYHLAYDPTLQYLQLSTIVGWRNHRGQWVCFLYLCPSDSWWPPGGFVSTLRGNHVTSCVPTSFYLSSHPRDFWCLRIRKKVS